MCRRRAPVKPEEIIRKNHARNFLIILLLILFAGTAASAVILYLDIYRPLNTHYSAILTIMTGVKDTLIMKSLKINALFFLLIAAGVGILTLLYTHRIAGPLYRIQLYAKSVSEGKLDTELTFRRKDAVTTFAESLNAMRKNYGGSVSRLSSEVQALKNSVRDLRETTDRHDGSDSEFKKLSSIDSTIKNIIETYKW